MSIPQGAVDHNYIMSTAPWEWLIVWRPMVYASARGWTRRVTKGSDSFLPGAGDGEYPPPVPGKLPRFVRAGS